MHRLRCTNVTWYILASWKWVNWTIHIVRLLVYQWLLFEDDDGRSRINFNLISTWIANINIAIEWTWFNQYATLYTHFDKINWLNLFFFPYKKKRNSTKTQTSIFTLAKLDDWYKLCNEFHISIHITSHSVETTPSKQSGAERPRVRKTYLHCAKPMTSCIIHLFIRLQWPSTVSKTIHNKLSFVEASIHFNPHSIHIFEHFVQRNLNSDDVYLSSAPCMGMFFFLIHFVGFNFKTNIAVDYVRSNWLICCLFSLLLINFWLFHVFCFSFFRFDLFANTVWPLYLNTDKNNELTTSPWIKSWSKILQWTNSKDKFWVANEKQDSIQQYKIYVMTKMW